MLFIRMDSPRIKFYVSCGCNKLNNIVNHLIVNSINLKTGIIKKLFIEIKMISIIFIDITHFILLTYCHVAIVYWTGVIQFLRWGGGDFKYLPTGISFIPSEDMLNRYFLKPTTYVK